MAIKIRRGNKADLVETNLSVGEPVIALDTKEVGIMGASGEMVWLATKDLINVANGIAGLDSTGKVPIANVNGGVADTRQIAGLALSSDITLAQLIAVGLAAGTNGQANDAAKLGGIPASSFPQISSGTWTPYLYGDTTAGAPTYAVQTGSYIKIGNLVNVFGQISITALGGMAGYLHMGGLPYAVSVPSATSDFNGGWSSDGTKLIGCYISGAGISLIFQASDIPTAYDIWSFHATYING